MYVLKKFTLVFSFHWRKYALNHIMPLVFFQTPTKYQKTRGFLVFSGSIERDQWHEMD